MADERGRTFADRGTNAPTDAQQDYPVPAPRGIGRGVLMVWTDYPVEDEPEFNEWYNRRHIPDRVPGVEGMDVAIRYTAIAHSRKYFAYYETRRPEILQTSAYLDLVRNRDPQTERILPRFRDTIRTVGRIGGEIRTGYGGHMLLIPMTAKAGREDELQQAANESVLPKLAGLEGAVRATLVKQDISAQNSSASLHVRKDRSFEWALLVDGTSDKALKAVTDSYFEPIRDAGGLCDNPTTFRAVMFATGAFT